MSSYFYDREKSSLRACVAVMQKNPRRRMTIYEIAAEANYSTDGVYKALTIAIRDGYIVACEKRKCNDGKGNHQKITYALTRKKFPPPKPLAPGTIKNRMREKRIREELDAAKRTDFIPFRHWMDAALFGPAQCEKPTPIERRVIAQEMSVDEEATA